MHIKEIKRSFWLKLGCKFLSAIPSRFPFCGKDKVNTLWKSKNEQKSSPKAGQVKNALTWYKSRTQGAATCSSRAESSLLLVFVNEVLSERSPAHLFTDSLWWLLHDTGNENYMNRCKRDCMTCQAQNIYYLALDRKSLLTSVAWETISNIPLKNEVQIIPGLMWRETR